MSALELPDKKIYEKHLKSYIEVGNAWDPEEEQKMVQKADKVKLPDIPDVVQNGEGGQFESPMQQQNNEYYDDQANARAATRQSMRPDNDVQSSKSFMNENPQQKRQSTMR